MDAADPAEPIASAGWPPGPAPAPDPGADVHLWIADLDQARWPPAAALPSAERARAERIARPEAAARWAASRWALRTVLARYLDRQPAAIEIETGDGGKPRLGAGQARPRFNLSHSGALALIAVSGEHEVGVDVELARPGRDFLALAERSFEPAAVEAVRTAAPEQRAGAFYTAWTRHEALAKCDGGGLGGLARDVAMVSATLDAGAGYAAAVAVAAAALPRLHEWSI